MFHKVDEMAHAHLAHVNLCSHHLPFIPDIHDIITYDQIHETIIRHQDQDGVYLIPGVVEQLLLLLHERGLLRKEAHADGLDVLQVLHVDVLHLWQQKPFVLFFFLLFLILTLVCVDFDEVVRGACGRVDDDS